LAAFTVAGVSLASAAVACASFAAGFSVLSDSGAGAAAADEDGLSWSENMVDGLREDNFLDWSPAEPGPPVGSMKFLANSQSGLCKEG
jgi:hypothetical protein